MQSSTPYKIAARPPAGITRLKWDYIFPSFLFLFFSATSRFPFFPFVFVFVPVFVFVSFFEGDRAGRFILRMLLSLHFFSVSHVHLGTLFISCIILLFFLYLINSFSYSLIVLPPPAFSLSHLLSLTIFLFPSSMNVWTEDAIYHSVVLFVTYLFLCIICVFHSISMFDKPFP